MTTAKNSKSLSTKSHVSCLIAYKVIGPEQGRQYSKEYEEYLAHNGAEWTCERYKAIYTAARHLANGDRCKAVEEYRKHSIAYHKDTLYPKGACKGVVEKFVTSKKPSVKRRFAGLLRCYTDITLPDKQATRRQSEKAIRSITGKSTCSLNSSEMMKLTRNFQLRWNALSESTRRKISEARETMSLHSTSYYYHNIPINKGFVERLAHRPYGIFVLSKLTESWIPESLVGQDKSDLPRQEQCDEYGVDSGYAGRILGMQQQGCKLRVVAQPTASLQQSFAPLHKTLQNVTEAMYSKESCVTYQERGIYSVIDHLKDGHPVFSVDLSSATDRFPRQYSEKLLDIMGLHRYSEALEDVCNRPWSNANLRGNTNNLYYEVGQPMGLYGSFPLFNLSNLSIADEAVAVAQFHWGDTLTPFRDGTYFKIVGDDIVLSDSHVAQLYQVIMEKLGCDISPSKTFAGQVAEFAGFMVVPSKEGPHAFRPYKFPKWEKITNPLELVHALGIKISKGEVSEKRREYWDHVFKTYSKTLSSRNLDLTPILWAEDDNFPVSIDGKERWLESLVNSIALEITSTRNHGSRTLACAQEWLEEHNGYAFMHETFNGALMSNLVSQEAHRHDEPFDPDIVVKYDKRRKKFFELEGAPKTGLDFFKDPLNAKIAYDEGYDTHSFKQLTHKAVLKAASLSKQHSSSAEQLSNESR